MNYVGYAWHVVINDIRIMKPTSTKNRIGSTLSEGSAHRADHANWSRRSFLQLAGMGGIATTLMAGGIPMQVFGHHAGARWVGIEWAGMGRTSCGWPVSLLPLTPTPRGHTKG